MVVEPEVAVTWMVYAPAVVPGLLLDPEPPELELEPPQAVRLA